jgi:hypothetical protein
LLLLLMMIELVVSRNIGSAHIQGFRN